MGCGCNNGATAMKTAGTMSDSYSSSYRCAKCLSKHLSKAAVEYAEAIEDRTRNMELALCIGDLACAEDHAFALGKNDRKAQIRSLRDRVWLMSPLVLQEMQRLASDAIRMVLLEQGREKSMGSVRRNDAADDSNDSNDSNDLTEQKNDASEK